MKQDTYPAQNNYPHVFSTQYRPYVNVNKHNVYTNNNSNSYSKFPRYQSNMETRTPQRRYPHFYKQGGVPRFEEPNWSGGYNQSISSAVSNYIFSTPR